MIHMARKIITNIENQGMDDFQCLKKAVFLI